MSLARRSATTSQGGQDPQVVGVTTSQMRVDKDSVSDNSRMSRVPLSGNVSRHTMMELSLPSIARPMRIILARLPRSFTTE